MSRRALLLGILLAGLLPGPARAQFPVIAPDPHFALPRAGAPGVAEVDSASLVENARTWDGKIVSFTGEVVGERMSRGPRAWIHLNDDAYMWKNIEEGAVLGGYNTGMAVWAADTEARRIAFFGDYKHEGDVVKVSGMFHAACPEHGGDMDIHAATLEVVRPGHPVGHVVNVKRGLVALFLLVLAASLYGARRGAERRRI